MEHDPSISDISERSDIDKLLLSKTVSFWESFRPRGWSLGLEAGMDCSCLCICCGGVPAMNKNDKATYDAAFFKTSKLAYWFQGSENLRGLNDLNRLDHTMASMTSTVSLASKNYKLLSLYILSDFPGISSLSSLNDYNSSTTSVASINSKPHQKTYWTWCFHQPCSLSVGRIIKNPESKIQYFMASFLVEAVEAILWDTNWI